MTESIMVTDCSFADSAFEEQCLPNIRWAGRELEQLWTIVEYRNGKVFDRRQEWREVPDAP